MSKRFFVLFFLSIIALRADLTQLETITGQKPTEWIQKGDRWDFEDRYKDLKEKILPQLEAMGLFDEKLAQNEHYDYALVLGALQGAVETRVNHLIKEWERGVRFNEVVFLTGQRPLHKSKEAKLFHLKTETAMMLYVWKNTEMPKEMRSIIPTIIDAPPLPSRGRPTTESTVYAWLEHSPKPGSVLMVSNQPYVNYQHAVLSALLPSFKIEGVGAAGGKNLSLSILMDTLGKETLWREKK